jgi:hypothetical protein
VFQSRVLRRMFGLQRYEVAEEWRRLLNNALYSPNDVRVFI